MTLGSIPSPADVVAELGESLPYTFPDAKSRWLAEVSSSAQITFPTSFANKISVKVVDTISTAANSSGTRTFTGVDFGDDFPGRIIVVAALLYNSSNVEIGMTGATIDGQSTHGQAWQEHITGSDAISVALFSADNTSGTSGTVSITHNNSTTDAGIIVISIAGISETTFNRVSNGGSGSGSTSASDTINHPSNAVFLVAAGHGNTNNTSMSGVTERSELTIGGARLAVGFDNRKGSQSNDAFSASWSGTAPAGIVGMSWAQ